MTNRPKLKLVLKVQHDGVAKMVGKVFTVDVPDDGLVSVFYHEESGTQEHHALDCPGGIDWAVIESLKGLGVEHIHHYDAEGKLLYMATRQQVEDYGIEGRWDGRTRLFLPRHYWTTAPLRWYQVPWVTTETTIHARTRERENPSLF